MSNNDMNINPRSNNMISHIFQKEELIDYTSDLKQSKCEILDYGLNETKSIFYFCECDPERCNPICEDCFRICHLNGKKYPHKSLINKEMKAVCICGYKCHKPLNKSEKQDKKYKVACTFGEHGAIPELNFSYQDVEQSNSTICIICYNICYETKQTIIKNPTGELKGFKCSCKNHNHSDIRIIFRKLKSLAKGNNFIKKFNFEGMTFLHCYNLLTTSKMSFQNLFHSFIDKIHQTVKNMQNIDYCFEEHNTLNDLHLTAQVLLVFAHKCKNEYKILNNMNSSKDELTEEKSEINVLKDDESENKSMGIVGGQIDFIRINCRPLCYFNDVIKDILTEKIYFKIMERKFYSKSRNIWQLKYYLTGIFLRFYIQKDFTYYPNFKVRDIVLLTPLQRTLMLSGIEIETKIAKYVNNLNINYLDNIINSIEAVISSKEKIRTLYLILAKLYKMCLIFAKFSLFNHEQLSRLCSLNGNILDFFDEEKSDPELDFLKLKVISPMMKILVFLSFYSNDQLILSYLKCENSSQKPKLNFYHEKTEISKNVSSNVISVLTFLQRFDDAIMEKQKLIELKKVKNENVEPSNKIQDILPPKQHYIKCFHQVYKNCRIILNMSLSTEETYRSSLVRLIDNDQYIMFNFIKNIYTQKEKDFLQKLHYFSEKLEDNYRFYFAGLNSAQADEKTTQNFEDIITECNKNFAPLLYHYGRNRIKTEEEDEEDIIIKKEDENENLDKKDEDNMNNKEEKNQIGDEKDFKYLIIKTYFVQSLLKFIHVMYYIHIHKNQPSDSFLIKTQVFKKIMEFFYNFINNSAENSFFFLQSDFTTNFELLNDDQLLQTISLMNIALENIAKSQRELASAENLFHFIKVALLKSSNEKLLDEILRVLRTFALYVNCLDYNDSQKKLMKFCKIIFNYHSTIKNYFVLMTSTKKSDRLKCFKKEKEVIIKKFMTILNTLINQNTIIEDKEFLDLIVTKDQLKLILFTKTINISLRTQLINYYRKCFLETVLDKKDINYYISLLINDSVSDRKDEIVDNPKYQRFIEILVKSGDYNGEISIEKDANTIKYELLNFQEVLTLTTEKVKIQNYLEAIIKCVVVYFAKFSAIFNDSNGYNFMSIYEIIYYFLLLKKYIYSRAELFKPNSNEKNKILFPKKFMGKQYIKKSLINLNDYHFEELKNSDKKNFVNRFLIKEKEKIINPKNEIEALYATIKKLEDQNFEFFDFASLKKIFIKNLKHFIKFPEFKNLKKYFEKAIVFSDEKQTKYKNYLKSIGRLKSNFDIDILSIIFYYINSKDKIEKSSFINVLDETNAHYNTSYRMLLCKAIPFFCHSFKNKYQQDAIWILFKLLQYDTTEIQQAFIELEEQNLSLEPLFDFNKLVQDFTSCIMTVILREINFNGYENVKDYFQAGLNLKLMKFFCEEHNEHFQTFFFNNTDSSLKNVIVRYKFHLRIKSQKKKDESEENLINIKEKEEKLNRRRSIFSAINQGDLLGGDIARVYSRKASVFEYLLRVLGKIILLSHWANKKDDDNEELDDYFYDIYFIILEFLIEMIQGNSRENLNKILTGEKRGKNLFQKVLTDIYGILIDDTLDASLGYIIRKDLIEFIMAFLEESATPPNGIVEISSVLLPSTILDSIIATMNKLYDELNVQKTENLQSEEEEKYYIKKTFKFSPEMKDFFSKYFYNNTNFVDDEKFGLANRMYHYFKMLGQSSAFKNSYVSELYFRIEMFTDAEVRKAYYNKNYKLINKETNAAITDNKFNDQYLCVSFFEEITRTVYVKKEDEEEQVSVIFTKNPIVSLLSKISKDDFIDNVDRCDRYTKLISLLERCDNFFAEIKFKASRGNKSFIRKMIDDIDFYILEVIAFIITLIINLMMLCVMRDEGDVLFGDDKINNYIIILGYINFLFNLVCIILWMIAKYRLLYRTECQKILKSYIDKYNINNSEEIEIHLSIFDKLYAAFIVLIKKNKILAFFWNIALSFFAAYTQVYILYIIQLFIVFNLSSTLRNLISSIVLRWGQLGSVFYFSIIVNLCLSSIAFYHFEEDFIKAIDSKMPHNYPEKFSFLNDLIGSVYTEPSHIEGECGTFAYCLMTHLDYGMRFDGGIADRMSKRSYNFNPQMYLKRFVYEMVYFWSQTVMLQGMFFSIVIEAFSELRNQELANERDKAEICFICGIDRASCEKNGQKFEEHVTKEHNLWTYVDYILGLRFVDIQDTNAINSFVMEKIEKKELIWFPVYKLSDDEKNDD